MLIFLPMWTIQHYSNIGQNHMTIKEKLKLVLNIYKQPIFLYKILMVRLKCKKKKDNIAQTLLSLIYLVLGVQHKKLVEYITNC